MVIPSRPPPAERSAEDQPFFHVPRNPDDPRVRVDITSGSASLTASQLVACCNFSWREAHNKMLLCRSIALDCLRKTLPPVDEDQRLALLHAPFKGTTLFGGELVKLRGEHEACCDLCCVPYANSTTCLLFFPSVCRTRKETPLKPLRKDKRHFRGKSQGKKQRGCTPPPPTTSCSRGETERVCGGVEAYDEDPYVLSIIAKGYRLRRNSGNKYPSCYRRTR